MQILLTTRAIITLSGMFSPVGHYLASASHDRTARMWSMHGIQPLRIMVGHLSDVDCLQWHVNCNCASPLAPVTKQFVFLLVMGV
uniref:Uncharacterized protein n=1 Tax=Salix viminalis TaxID=40686 RepID=A0A6N2K1M3_SALVM